MVKQLLGEIELNRIYQRDCLEGMRMIPDDTIDMILCDLPYGTTRNKWDTVIPFEPLWEQYARVIKDNGAIVLFSHGLFSAKLQLSKEKWWRYDLEWEKDRPTGFLNAKKMPLRSHEDIQVFYKKLPVYNPQMSVGKPLHSKGSSYLIKPAVNNNYGKFEVTDDSRKGNTEKYPRSILKFKRPHPPIHPTQKPVELFEYLIKTYTNEGDIVLDNCMGSGTTAIAAVRSNRNFIGFELEREYVEIANQRLDNEKGR